MDKITTLSILLQITAVALVWVFVLLDDKKRSYKKRGLLIDKREEEIATLNQEIRQLVTGDKFEKAHIRAKYKLQYSIEDQSWYGGCGFDAFRANGAYDGVLSHYTSTKIK